MRPAIEPAPNKRGGRPDLNLCRPGGGGLWAPALREGRPPVPRVLSPVLCRNVTSVREGSMCRTPPRWGAGPLSRLIMSVATGSVAAAYVRRKVALRARRPPSGGAGRVAQGDSHVVRGRFPCLDRWLRVAFARSRASRVRSWSSATARGSIGVSAYSPSGDMHIGAPYLSASSWGMQCVLGVYKRVACRCLTRAARRAIIRAPYLSASSWGVQCALGVYKRVACKRNYTGYSHFVARGRGG